MCAIGYDGKPIRKDDFVAVYEKLAALHYVPERTEDPSKAVHGVDIVESIDGGIKLRRSGWWPVSRIISITRIQYWKWLWWRKGRHYIDADEMRAEIRA